jgi:hypothetical protein
MVSLDDVDGIDLYAAQISQYSSNVQTSSRRQETLPPEYEISNSLSSDLRSLRHGLHRLAFKWI